MKSFGFVEIVPQESLPCCWKMSLGLSNFLQAYSDLLEKGFAKFLVSYGLSFCQPTDPGVEFPSVLIPGKPGIQVLEIRPHPSEKPSSFPLPRCNALLSPVSASRFAHHSFRHVLPHHDAFGVAQFNAWLGTWLSRLSIFTVSIFAAFASTSGKHFLSSRGCMMLLPVLVIACSKPCSLIAR